MRRLRRSPSNYNIDNALNNDVMVDELANRLENFAGRANHIRCFAHIINLVVKAILREFDAP